MALNPDELEKQIKDLGAQLLSLREELKAMQAAPRPDPKDVSAIRTEMEDLKKRLDALKDLDRKKDPPPPPGNQPPLKPRRGFGFFKYE